MLTLIFIELTNVIIQTTPRGRSLVSIAVYYEVTPHLVFRCARTSVTEGIVLGHKVSTAGLEVDKAKIDVIGKLPPPTNVKAVRSFIEHAGFYRRFIKDFSKISRPMTKLLEKDAVFDFNKECIEAFESLKEKLTNALIMVSPDWSQPFELMCDASDFAVGAQDAKPHLIRWILQLQEFDIKIKNRNRAENVTADHLSRLENPNLEELRDEDIDDNFPNETLMNVSSNDEGGAPWFVDFANYLVGKILRKGLTYTQRCKFFLELKHYFWDDPYLFKMYPDGMIKRCVYGFETKKILDECHHGPTEGHYGPSTTTKKVFDAGFLVMDIDKKKKTKPNWTKPSTLLERYPVIHQPRQEMSTEMMLAKEKLIKAIRTCLKNNNQPPKEKSIAVLLAEENILTIMQTLEEKHIDTESMQELLLQFSKDLPTLGNTSNQLKQEEQDSSQYWNPPIYYSNDDDDFYRESIDETPPLDVITPDLPITDSLVIEDEHLDTPEIDSDEEIKSSVENLNLTPSESEDLSDYVSEYDFPFCDNSSDFNNDSEIFSNPLFDSNADYTSSDDESSFDEDVSVENFKIYSNPLLEFDEEIFSSGINPLYNEVLEDLDSIPPGNENDHFNAESDFIESLLNKDTMITSPKIDFLLEEFAGELALIIPIPPGIAETNFDPKESIRLIKKLLYDNSSPRPPKELNSENDFEKENSGSTTIYTDISLPEYESFDDESDYASEIFNDDLAHIISPSEYEYVYANDESYSGDSTRKLQMSHRGFKALKISHNFFNKIPMMIYGGDMPILDVPYLHFYPP
ncbi:reverse transcriptase domain-containing protein [Tanacetum coccineum]